MSEYTSTGNSKRRLVVNTRSRSGPSRHPPAMIPGHGMVPPGMLHTPHMYSVHLPENFQGPPPGQYQGPPPGQRQGHRQSNRSHSHPLNQRLYVDDEDVGFVIGRGGETVKRIKRQSGALIKHFAHEGDDPKHDTGYFNLRGDQFQIHQAKIAIQELVIESKRREIEKLRSGSGGNMVSSIQNGDSSPQYSPQSPTYAPPIGDWGATITSVGGDGK